MTPLKQARTLRCWTLADVSARLAQLGDQVDTGNLSRIERGAQRASTALAENLCKVFNTDIQEGQERLTEIHILYPERFPNSDDAAA